jgi:PAS domain S-box-containing protein
MKEEKEQQPTAGLDPKYADLSVEASLEQERYLMAALMESLPDHIYFKDLNSRFIRNNMAHAHSMGLKDPSEMSGKSDFDFFMKEVAQRQFDDEQEIIRTGLPVNKEERTVRSDGSVNWYSTTKMPLRNSMGKIIGTFGISRDITERKKTEHELRKLSQAIEQSPVSIVITNQEGDIEYANPKACETTGYELKELFGKNPRVLKSGETSSQEYSFLWNTITQGSAWKGLFHNKKKNGELYWESATIAPIKDNQGNITHYLGVKEDITEKLHIENALRESESQLRSFFDLPLIGHAMTSPTKGWLDVNSSLCNLLGYSREELVKTTWPELTYPDDLEADNEKFALVMADKIDGYSMEKRFIRKDKKIINTHLAVQCMRNPDRTVNYFMVVIVDITDRKKAEEEIRLKNEVLLRTNAEKDKFFSIIAHDLRSPFNSFINLSKIIAEDVNEMSLGDIQRLATRMSKSASSLFELLENLLEWSKIQRGLSHVHPESLSVDKKIDKLIAVYSETARAKGISLNASVEPDLMVFADRMMIESTLRNLLSNAIKFTNQGGSVDISARNCPNNRCILVTVADTGIGMSQEILGKLFRIDESVSRKGTSGESSSGLGLLLCKDFVEKNGGRIWVESVEGKGSTFSFTVPAKD